MRFVTMYVKQNVFWKQSWNGKRLFNWLRYLYIIFYFFENMVYMCLLELIINTVNIVILVWRGHSIYFASSSVHADVNELKEKFNIWGDSTVAVIVTSSFPERSCLILSMKLQENWSRIEILVKMCQLELERAGYLVSFILNSPITAHEDQNMRQNDQNILRPHIF